MQIFVDLCNQPERTLLLCKKSCNFINAFGCTFLHTIPVGKGWCKSKKKCSDQNKNLTKTTYVGYLLPEVFLQERCYRRNYDFKVVAIRSVDAVGSGTIFKHPESVETFPGRQVLPPQISFNRYITGSFTSPMLSSCLYIHIFLTVPKIHLWLKIVARHKVWISTINSFNGP